MFVGILENLSHIHPLRGGNRYHLQYTYQYAVFALSPAGTDLPLIVTISIIINKLTMINIATASRSDIIIIVRLLLLLLFHINNIYMEYPYMREILYATGYNKEKKRIRRSYCPGYCSFLLDDYIPSLSQFCGQMLSPTMWTLHLLHTHVCFNMYSRTSGAISSAAYTPNRSARSAGVIFSSYGDPG